jgi:hypothetical protein
VASATAFFRPVCPLAISVSNRLSSALAATPNNLLGLAELQWPPDLYAHIHSSILVKTLCFHPLNIVYTINNYFNFVNLTTTIGSFCPIYVAKVTEI